MSRPCFAHTSRFSSHICCSSRPLPAIFTATTAGGQAGQPFQTTLDSAVTHHLMLSEIAFGKEKLSSSLCATCVEDLFAKLKKKQGVSVLFSSLCLLSKDTSSLILSRCASFSSHCDFHPVHSPLSRKRLFSAEACIHWLHSDWLHSDWSLSSST